MLCPLYFPRKLFVYCKIIFNFKIFVSFGFLNKTLKKVNYYCSCPGIKFTFVHYPAALYHFWNYSSDPVFLALQKIQCTCTTSGTSMQKRSSDLVYLSLQIPDVCTIGETDTGK